MPWCFSHRRQRLNSDSDLANWRQQSELRRMLRPAALKSMTSLGGTGFDGDQPCRLRAAGCGLRCSIAD